MDKKGNFQNLSLGVNYTMANLLIVNGCCIHHQLVQSFALLAHYSQAHILIFPHLDLMKNASKCISGHENGPEHHINMLTYSSRQKESGQLDSVLLKQFYNVQLYWQNVLKRIVAVVKFLSSRGLSFRGNNETIGSGQMVTIWEFLSY